MRSVQFPLAFRGAIEVQPSEIFQRIPASVPAQPCSRGCCRRCHRRGEEVGNGNRSPWGRTASAQAKKHYKLTGAGAGCHQSSERVESCKKFFDRARQWVSRAQDVIDKATAQKRVHEAEVAEVERRLAQLQVEATKPVGEVPPQVSVLQGQIDSGTRRRSSSVGVRQACQVDGQGILVSKQSRPRPPICGMHSSSGTQGSSARERKIGQLVKSRRLVAVLRPRVSPDPQ